MALGLSSPPLQMPRNHQCLHGGGGRDVTVGCTGHLRPGFLPPPVATLSLKVFLVLQMLSAQGSPYMFSPSSWAWSLTSRV